jgi:hypothetical protein
MKTIDRRIPCLGLAAILGFALSAAGGDMTKADDAKSNSDKPLATAKHDKGLIVEVLEIKRDDHEQLYIRWRYKNPSDKSIELLPKSPPIGAGPKTAFLKSINYESGKIDTDKAYRIPVVNTVKGNNWRAKDLPKGAVVIGPNMEYEFWAYFYLPRNESDVDMTLHLPDTAALEGLKVPSPGKK